MTKERKAAIDLVVVVLIWAVAGVSYKVFNSVGITLAAYFVITRFFKLLSVGAIYKATEKKQQPLKNYKELGLIFLNALFSVATPILFFTSLLYTSLSNTYFLSYTMPAWVLVFAVIFLGEKITLKKLTGLILTIIGVIAIAKPEDLLSLGPGVILPLLAALSFSADVITARELKDYSYSTVSLFSNIFQFLFFLPILVTFGVPVLQNPTLSWLALILTGIALGIASYIYYFALDNIEASKAAVITLLELVFASILAYFFFREVPSANELFGYLLIMQAIIILVLRRIDIENFERLLYLNRKP